METGDRIGRYVVKGKLASGGMAEVYRAAREGVLGVSREVCIKRMRRELGGPEFVEMFRDEARIASQLRHPNVVGVEDFGE